MATLPLSVEILSALLQLGVVAAVGLRIISTQDKLDDRLRQLELGVAAIRGRLGASRATDQHSAEGGA